MNEYIEKQLKNVPKLTIENSVILEAYGKALENLLCINTVPCSMEVYNKTGLLDENLPLMIRAGGGYETPWTRDASVNTMNAACFLEPEVAKNTLWAVCERVDGKLCFQLDNQKWDKIVWAIGAWQYFLATEDKVFLQDAYHTVKNSLEVLEQVQFNETYGLFTGGSFFNDGITGYPKAVHEEGKESSFVGDHKPTEYIMTLSTNCLYYASYRILEKMVSVLGIEGEKENYIQKGTKLKNAINQFLWNEKTGKYDYFLYPDGTVDNSQEGCGISFASLFELGEEENIRKMLSECVRSEVGLVSIWPPFKELSSLERPIRHNNLIWTMVNGYFANAVAKYGLSEILGAEIESMAQLAMDSKGFYEIYNPITKKPDGGWQVGCQWDSVPNQTWSATAFISSIVYGVFGIRLSETGITFKPCLPENFGTVQLKGIKFRNVTLDIKLQGAGNKVKEIKINGEKEEKISFEKEGKYQVEIWLEK